MNRKYGYLKQSPDHRDLNMGHLKAVRPMMTQLPDEVDLRTVDCPVFDQGNLGSCVANALCGLLMHNEDINQSGSFEELSRLFLYYNARVITGDVDEDGGCQVRDAIKSLASCGITSESLWRYQEDQFAIKPPELAYTDAKTRVIDSYYSLDGEPQAMIDNIRTALAAGHPVVFGMQVYSSFESDAVAQTGLMPVPNIATETYMGGHSTLIMGYSTANQWFIVKNSWGPDFGDHGFYYLPYQVFLLGLCSDPWVVLK